MVNTVAMSAGLYCGFSFNFTREILCFLLLEISLRAVYHWSHLSIGRIPQPPTPWTSQRYCPYIRLQQPNSLVCVFFLFLFSLISSQVVSVSHRVCFTNAWHPHSTPDRTPCSMNSTKIEHSVRKCFSHLSLLSNAQIP